MVRDERRERVYEAVDVERDYQNGLGEDRTDGSKKSVGDYLTMLSHYLHQARTQWTDNAGNQDALAEIRKVAAIAVRCMEEHGIQPRLTMASKK